MIRTCAARMTTPVPEFVRAARAAVRRSDCCVTDASPAAPAASEQGRSPRVLGRTACRAPYLHSAGVQLLFDLARGLDVARRRFGIVIGEDSPLRAVLKTTHVDEATVLCAGLDECVEAVTDISSSRFGWDRSSAHARGD